MERTKSIKERTKRVDIVNIQMVKESSLKYQYRTINKPQDVCQMINQMINKSDRECFGLICVDTKNQPTHITIVSVGNLNSSIVHPREVFKAAILSNSASVIIFHNHLSGNPTPSQADIETTKRLVEAGKILGINLVDHIIVADENYISMKEKMLI